ncbi:MAG TPA: hypothetical protein PL117_15060, partial [Accumulibacter sp.]|uniref:hypothetical protein n=1 Tax=Accumulibacter sp. TaxID=2053492 RepID=UPI002B5FF664
VQFLLYGYTVFRAEITSGASFVQSGLSVVADDLPAPARTGSHPLPGDAVSQACHRRPAKQMEAQ